MDYFKSLKEVRALIKKAETPELQAIARQKIANLLANPEIKMEDFAKQIGFKVEEGRKGVRTILIYQELEKKFPPLRINIEENEDAPSQQVKFVKSHETFLPPDKQDPPNGEGEFIPPKIFPRTQLAISVLKEMGIDLKKCKFLEGTNTPDMMRNLSYRAIIIPEIDRVIFVCDEEGNNTFVIYQADCTAYFYNLKKSQLKDLGNLVIVLRWCDEEDWKLKLMTLLEKKETKKDSEKIDKPNIEKAPNGWMTNKGLANKLGVGFKKIKTISEKFRKTHLEWFGEYRDMANKPEEHYSPELCEAIRKEIEKVKPAPEGWMTNRGLANKLGVGFRKIKTISEKFKKSNPKWFIKYQDQSNRPQKHYSQELCEAIRKEIEKVRPAPEGWMTNEGLTNKLRVSYQLTRKIAEKFRKAHPEWFWEYRDMTNKPEEHYSQELCEAIRKEIEKVKPAPEGWMTKNGLSEKLGVGKRLTRKIAEKFRKTHPEWFRKYRDKCNRPNEHCSLELCEAIRKEIEKVKPAPEGWMTNAGLAIGIGKNKETIKKRAEEYQETNPEWFREYRSRQNKPEEHYSPELCGLIRQELKK